jgi:AcrR family transcriptional regulator
MQNKNLLSYQKEYIQSSHPASDKKWKIVQVAAQQFIKSGVDKTTLKDIAEASGIVVGTLYFHYKSKDEIINDFVHSTVYASKKFFMESDLATKSLDTREALRKAIKRYFAYIHEAQDLILFWQRETKNLKPEIRKELLDGDSIIVDTFAKILERGIVERVFKPMDSKLVSNSIVVLLEMWAYRRWTLRNYNSPAKFINKQVKFILDSITKEIKN